MLAIDLLNLCETMEDLPAIYPEVKLPIDVREMQRLYDLFNKKYFDGKLRKIPLKIRSFKGKFGHVLTVYNRKSGQLIIKELTLNKLVNNNRKRFINTLLHEMIHVENTQLTQDTGDFKYFKTGHGRYFLDKMNYLNSVGFNISVTSDIEMEATTDKEYYGIVFKTDTGGVIPFATKKKLSSKAIETLTKKLVSIFTQSRSNIVSYQTLKTSNVKYAMGAFQASDKGTIRVKNPQSYIKFPPLENPDIKLSKPVEVEVKNPDQERIKGITNLPIDDEDEAEFQKFLKLTTGLKRAVKALESSQSISKSFEKEARDLLAEFDKLKQPSPNVQALGLTLRSLLDKAKLKDVI